MHLITTKTYEDQLSAETSVTHDVPSTVTSRKTAFIYGARSRTFQSGSAYYFARSLELYGKLREAFELVDLPPRRAREIPFDSLIWFLASKTSRTALFLLSQRYHDASARGLEVDASVQPYFIVFAQCIPASIRACRRARPGARIIVYIDATLLDLFDDFDYACNPPAHLREKMLRDEREGYRETDLFAVFHANIRDRLIKDYGVAPEKIWVVGRGVNLEQEIISSPKVEMRSSRDQKFHMMLVGRGAKRKGVFRLIEAIETLSPEEQDRVVLTVAGPEARELPDKPYLRSLGFVSADQREYLAQEMIASDLGVLLSEADSLPGSIWEFLALGIPVWVTRLPQMAESLESFPAILEDLPLAPASVAERLRTFIHRPQELAALRTNKANSGAGLNWAVPAARLGEYIRGR
jgi:glycosyltransferase involved in cell wall biosynthesis